MPSRTPFLMRNALGGASGATGFAAAVALSASPAGPLKLAAQAARTEVFRKSRRDDFCMMPPSKWQGVRSQNAECRMQNAEWKVYLFHAALKEFDGPMPKSLSRDLSHSDF